MLKSEIFDKKFVCYGFLKVIIFRNYIDEIQFDDFEISTAIDFEKFSKKLSEE